MYGCIAAAGAAKAVGAVGVGGGGAGVREGGVGDRVGKGGNTGWAIYAYCDLNSIKQTFQTNSKGQLFINKTMCLYSPKIKKRNAES
jgi:hypothetical protein